jgi:hypothetical protein
MQRTFSERLLEVLLEAHVVPAFVEQYTKPGEPAATSVLPSADETTEDQLVSGTLLEVPEVLKLEFVQVKITPLLTAVPTARWLATATI